MMIPMSAPISCRVCGCTDDNACVDLWSNPCWWVEGDLCSECEQPDPGPATRSLFLPDGTELRVPQMETAA